MTTATQTVMPSETENIDLLEENHSAKVALNLRGEELHLTRHQLIDWWDAKLLNDASYCAMALLMDKPKGAFNIYSFISRWEGIPAEGKDEGKRLKEDLVLKVVNAMEKAEMASSEVQMRLELFE